MFFGFSGDRGPTALQDRGAKSAAGLTAWDLAKDFGEVMEVLEEKGEKGGEGGMDRG